MYGIYKLMIIWIRNAQLEFMNKVNLFKNSSLNLNYEIGFFY